MSLVVVVDERRRGDEVVLDQRHITMTGSNDLKTGQASQYAYGDQPVCWDVDPHPVDTDIGMTSGSLPTCVCRMICRRPLSGCMDDDRDLQVAMECSK